MEIALWVIVWLASGVIAIAVRYMSYHRIDLGEMILVPLAGPIGLLVAAYIWLEQADISFQREYKK